MSPTEWTLHSIAHPLQSIIEKKGRSFFFDECLKINVTYLSWISHCWGINNVEDRFSSNNKFKLDPQFNWRNPFIKSQWIAMVNLRFLIVSELLFLKFYANFFHAATFSMYFHLGRKSNTSHQWRTISFQWRCLRLPLSQPTSKWCKKKKTHVIIRGAMGK